MMKAFKVVVTVARALSVIGLVIGVVFIVLSYRFYNTLEDFRKTGIRTSGVITDLYDNGNLRYTSYFVDIDYARFNAKDQKEVATAKRVEVYFKAARDLKTGDAVQLYYKPGKQASDILLVVNYEPENVPLSRKPWWGWGMAIVSACIAGSYQIGKMFNKRK